MAPGLPLLLYVLLFWLGPSGPAQARPEVMQASSRNPHGAITIACDSCHTFTSWKPIRNVPDFDHSRTRFPLRGMHESVRCRQCHILLEFGNVGARCADCHADLHRGQFGGRCEQCHTVKGWNIAVKSIQNHQNRFPLLGAHTTVECDACHKGGAGGQFTGLPTDCLSCHTKDYQSATQPDHQALGFPSTCQDCHAVNSWYGAKFDHLRFAGYALTGAHAALPCASCHAGGKYKGTLANCYACHVNDFNKTTNPNHVQAAFPTDCSFCHSTATWAGAKFGHNAWGGFPLTGAHVNVPCAQCHINGKYAGTPKDCASCHLPAYQSTTNPNHAQAGFPTDCSLCHSTASWAGAKFDHSQTLFPLTGAHVNVPCATCHVNGVYKGLSTACVSCHLNNYNATANPNHVQAGYPQTCEVCHNTTAWQPASFDHSKTPFPLTGAHVTVPCTSCHVGGKYAGTPADCYSCHKAAYLGTTDPNHVAAAFPTTCQTCHTTTSWLGATFNHTWFPIYSGKHQGQWTTCADCHVNSSNYAVFSCITCHAHDRTIVDPKHQGVGGYVYNATSCYSCHPQGVAGN